MHERDTSKSSKYKGTRLLNFTSENSTSNRFKMAGYSNKLSASCLFISLDLFLFYFFIFLCLNQQKYATLRGTVATVNKSETAEHVRTKVS